LSSITRCIWLFTLLCQPLIAMASTVHRCEDDQGHITFTTLSCTPGERLSTHEVRSYMPGTTMAILPEAENVETSRMNIKPKELVVVGQQERPCGGDINPSQRREAIINRRIIAGMNQQDVESVLGKPDKISTRNSGTSYQYAPKRGRSAQVVFDEKGCVKGKSQTAKSPR